MIERKTTIDPRVKRTRQLIIDAFLYLVSKKDFKDITVKDITTKATINRATFYAHFQDKYDLFDYTIGDNLNKILEERVNLEAELDEDFIKNLIVSVCDYHKSVSNACKKGYLSVVHIMDKKAKQTITDILLDKLNNHNLIKNDDSKINLLTIMISNSITGAAYEWNNTDNTMSSMDVAKEILPFIMSGIHSML